MTWVSHITNTICWSGRYTFTQSTFVNLDGHCMLLTYWSKNVDGLCLINLPVSRYMNHSITITWLQCDKCKAVDDIFDPSYIWQTMRQIESVEPPVSDRNNQQQDGRLRQIFSWYRYLSEDIRLNSGTCVEVYLYYYTTSLTNHFQYPKSLTLCPCLTASFL